MAAEAVPATVTGAAAFAPMTELDVDVPLLLLDPQAASTASVANPTALTAHLHPRLAAPRFSPDVTSACMGTSRVAPAPDMPT